MARFTVLRFPFLTATGEPLSLAPSQWAADADLRGEHVRIQFGSHGRFFNFRDVVAVHISEEKEVTAVSSTLGRMALTGVGAALLSQGRRGGVGASLLDLSIRGAVKKNVVTGTMVWPDTTILGFSLKGKEIDRFLRAVPKRALDEDALEDARKRLDLLERMRSDGRRAIEELTQEITRLESHVDALHVTSEQGASFSERDGARQEALAHSQQITTMRTLCFALQADLGVSTRDLTGAPPKDSSETRSLRISAPAGSTSENLPTTKPWGFSIFLGCAILGFVVFEVVSLLLGH
jgi:hypothetical protein